MPHICRLMVWDFEEGIGRHDERGAERYDARDLGNAVIYCEDLIEAGYTVCPSQGWDLAAMKAWAEKKLAELEPRG